MNLLRRSFLALFGLAAVTMAVSCSDGRKNVDLGNGPHDGEDLSMEPGKAYGDLGGNDGGQCAPGQMPATCAAPKPSDDGCGAVELCGTAGTGNGLDDNCDGKVDETCTCTSGNVQTCFVGPPGKRGVGACTDGQQTCTGGEIAFWGPCTGSISPSAESCDGLDNDCNGCADDGLCCDSQLECPTTVPEVLPYTDVSYMGGAYFKGSATTWSWTVTGGPCDRLFATTTGTPPAQSFTITGGNTANAKIHFTLSGDYTITMTVTDSGGHKSTCTWVQHVAGPGVRFELCWDTTGFFGSDLDLHVHKPNSTTDFFKASDGTDSGDDCNYRNCKAEPLGGDTPPSWGYGSSPLANCSGGPEGLAWTSLGSCRNPRLDIDNILNPGTPENINIDKPNNGETFRALVHYFDTRAVFASSVTHPLVNIYCGGRLKTTYGQAPNLVPNFSAAGQWAGRGHVASRRRDAPSSTRRGTPPTAPSRRCTRRG